MKTRVFSVRVSYDTIAYCYRLQEVAGRTVRGKPVSTIVGETLEAVISASRRMAGIADIETEAEVDALLESYVEKMPGFEAAVKPDWNSLEHRVDTVTDELRKPTATAKPAEREETRPDKASANARPDVAIHDGDVVQLPGESIQRVLRDVTPVPGHVRPDYVEAGEKQYICSCGFPSAGPGAHEHDRIVPEDNGVDLPDGDWAPGFTERCVPEGEMSDERCSAVESVIDAVVQAELAKDEQALKDVVDLGQVARVSPDVVPTVIPKCPWIGVTMLAETTLEGNTYYAEAMKIDELFGMAMRVVFAVVPEESWKEDKILNLVKKTYKEYKEWREKYDTGRVWSLTNR